MKKGVYFSYTLVRYAIATGQSLDVEDIEAIMPNHLVKFDVVRCWRPTSSSRFRAAYRALQGRTNQGLSLPSRH
jgi:hypothetical protein